MGLLIHWPLCSNHTPGVFFKLLYMNKEKNPTVPGGVLKLAVPLYQDAIQPSVKEVGDVLKRTVRLALLPVRSLLWGFEQIEEFVYTKVSERLKFIKICVSPQFPF